MPLIDPVTMAAPPTKASASQLVKAREAAAAMQPIEILTNPAAKTIRHLQPALLSALFLYQFGSLVVDPVRTLQNSLPVVAAIQIIYTFVCLPVAGAPTAKPAKKLRPGEKKKAEKFFTGPNPFVATFLSLVLTILATPVLHATFVLFGAPFLTHIPHTLLCSANLALLTLFPLFYVHGVDSGAWVAVGGALAPLDETFGGLIGGFAGAWLGAVPIPLDWDREWQKWPVTILCGLYGGYIIGKLIGGTVAFGKRMGSSPTKVD